ncbi:MAG: MmgE/PrpD family protein, partial [Pseudomonadota bacterium]
MAEVAAPQEGDSGPDVTEQLASFVAGTRFDDLPKEVVELAKRCILDGTAVMIAGSTEPCAKIARDYVKAVDGVEEATIIGSGDLRAPVHLAALANGVAGHALDWDD